MGMFLQRCQEILGKQFPASSSCIISQVTFWASFLQLPQLPRFRPKPRGAPAYGGWGKAAQNGADWGRRGTEALGNSRGLGLGECQVIGSPSPTDIPWRKIP